MIDKITCTILARRSMFILALFGLFVSSYLFITYIYGGPIVCGASYGCDIVRASRWASVYGVPTPLLGIVFYTVVAGLVIVRTAMPTYRAKLLYRLLMLVITVGLIESAFLTFVQVAEIGAYCFWCLASGVTATLLFIIAWWDRRIEVESGMATRELKFQFFTLLIAAIVGTVAILILTTPETDGERPVIRVYEPSEEEREEMQKLLYREGMTYEGPGDAPVTVVEFLDFQCSACRGAHAELKKVRDEMRGTIRFTYRHFPHPSREYSLGAARAVVCAEAQGNLFPYVDVLMEEQGVTREDLIRYAAELRLDLDEFVPCLESQETKERVEQDLHDGDALGITSTPTVFINTTMIDGLPNAERVMGIVERELE